MDVSATLTGLVGAITGGQGSARSSGSVGAGPQPDAFSIATRTASSGIAVRMALAHGNVVQTEITPPLVDMQDRVPVTAAMKRSIMDPASALVMPVRAGTAPTDPANCDAHPAALRRGDPLRRGAELRGDAGGAEARLCRPGPRLQRPLPGDRRPPPDRPGVKFMEDNREMSVWLAPVEGTKVLVPLRISVLTEIGTNIIEATRWTRAGETETAGRAGDPALAQASLPGQ